MQYYKKFNGRIYSWLGHFPSFCMKEAKEKYRKEGYEKFRTYKKYELYGWSHKDDKFTIGKR